MLGQHVRGTLPEFERADSSGRSFFVTDRVRARVSLGGLDWCNARVTHAREHSGGGTGILTIREWRIGMTWGVGELGGHLGCERARPRQRLLILLRAREWWVACVAAVDLIPRRERGSAVGRVAAEDNVI